MKMKLRGQTDRNTLGLPAGLYGSTGSSGIALTNLLGIKHQNGINIIFPLSESFLCGRDETNLHFSLFQCHVVSCT